MKTETRGLRTINRNESVIYSDTPNIAPPIIAVKRLCNSLHNIELNKQVKLSSIKEVDYATYGVPMPKSGIFRAVTL